MSPQSDRGLTRKSGLPKEPALLKAVCPVSLLPNNPARQKATSHKQSTSAQRDQRSTTRVGERATSRSGSRSGSRAAATAGRSRSGLAAAATGAYVNGAVLKRKGRAEAREHLLLVNPEGLRSPGNRAGAFTGLVLRVHGSLDLVTRVLQDRNIPTGRRLGEGWGCGCQHHGQHRCQQHYLPQINASSLTRFDVPWESSSFLLSITHLPLLRSTCAPLQTRPNGRS